MKTELKNKWVAALRSGEYKQGKEFLCKNDSYCCLGVLLAVDKTDEFIYDETVHDDRKLRYYQDEAYELPYSYQESIGLRGGDSEHLMIMNDGQPYGKHPTEPKTFDEIATWIEENL